MAYVEESLTLQVRLHGQFTVYLDWSMQGLDKVPEEGCEGWRLPHLQELDLSYNQLVALPPTLFPGLVSLRTLDLSRNELRVLPASIGALVTLEELYLAGNKLPTLPREIGALQELRVLNCAANVLEEVPSAALAPLLNLRLLDLYGNERLRTLPDEVATLPRLNSLFVTRCDLRALPDGLEDAPSLRLVRWQENPHLMLSEDRAHRLGRLQTRTFALTRQVPSRSYHDDHESVHTHSIQESVRASLRALVQDDGVTWSCAEAWDDARQHLPPATVEVLDRWAASDSTVDVALPDDTRATFRELFKYAWWRIKALPETVRILEQEVAAGAHKCFTRRVSLLVSTLCGFYPDMHVQISEPEQIAAVIQATGATLRREQLYSSAKHRAAAEAALRDLQIDPHTIAEWVQHI